MKIHFDLAPIGDGRQFTDPDRGDILYIPFRLEIDGQCYPAEDWEDYAVVNLLQWAEVLTSEIPREDQRFQFMDDAWELRWKAGLDRETGTLSMVHSGLDVVLFEHGPMRHAELVEELEDALSRMSSGLSNWLQPQYTEPAEMIQKLNSALAGLQAGNPKPH
jgi:hypothetical protein